jgi:poly(3-hydroxybutyrate) depolymerase
MTARRKRRLPPIVIAAGLMIGVSGGAIAAANQANEQLAGTCPAAFEARPGKNSGFQSGGADREFHAYLPADIDSAPRPRPVFVALTGTVEEEDRFAATNADLDALTDEGWIVLAPIRQCTTLGINCNGPGRGGWVWEPWNDGTPRPRSDVGPDGEFVVSMVQCVARKWPVARNSIYVGGISAGGTFTNRLLTYRSEFFAGGINASGMWYVDNAAVAAEPARIVTGRCCPVPLPPMNPAIVINLFGGPTDIWGCPGPACSDYRPNVQAASNYYASQENVVTISCTGIHGHRWPRGAAYQENLENREGFNRWAAATLRSHPKDSDPSQFRMTPPPAPYTCVRGRYTDLYPIAK